MSARWLLVAVAVVGVGALALAVGRPAQALNLLAALGPGERLAEQAYGPLPRHRFDLYRPPAGYNAAMVALDARWLSASGHAPGQLADWIGLAGPYDFVPIKNPDEQPVFHHPDVPPDSQLRMHADRPAPPTLLGAAVNDTLVDPQRNTRALAARLAAAGTAVTLRLYKRTNHMTLIGTLALPLRWLAPLLDDVQAFVQVQPPAGDRR